ncbi:MAG: PEGA domain-containing protein, partial [Deltaproteobacteria bacterium]|nr:PEGA domain-containing protein [Deltaproteobacteria bacterium]
YSVTKTAIDGTFVKGRDAFDSLLQIEDDAKFEITKHSGKVKNQFDDYDYILNTLDIKNEKKPHKKEPDLKKQMVFESDKKELKNKEPSRLVADSVNDSVDDLNNVKESLKVPLADNEQSKEVDDSAELSEKISENLSVNNQESLKEEDSNDENLEECEFHHDTMPVDLEELTLLEPEKMAVPVMRNSLPPAIIPGVPPLVLQLQKSNKRLKFFVVLLLAALIGSLYFNYKHSKTDSVSIVSGESGDLISGNISDTAKNITSVVRAKTPTNKKDSDTDIDSAQIVDPVKVEKESPVNKELPVNKESNDKNLTTIEKMMGESPKKKVIEEPPKKKVVEDPAQVKVSVPKKSSEKTGTLNITLNNSTKEDVEILIDGRKKGKAPLSVKLKKGLHEITFIKNGERTIRIVSIKDDQTKTISPNF